MSEYNGWKNYETWNIALWIGNDESFYQLAKKCKNYQDFLNGQWTNFTKDNVSFTDDRLDIAALNELIKEL